MKIVFLVKRYYTSKDLVDDEFGRLFHFPSLLAASGHECIVYALDFRNTQSQQVRKSGVQFKTLPVRSAWRLPRVFKQYKAILASQADVLFSSGDSYVGYLGLYLSKRMSCKSVFDIYDDYTQFVSNKIPFMRSLFHKAVIQSHLLVYASEALRQKYQSYQQSTLLLQNGVDTRVFKPAGKRESRAVLGLAAEDLIVGYFGSIHKPRGIDDLLAAVEILRRKRPEMRLLIAGCDLGEVSLQKPWVDYRGMVKQQDLVALINASDVVTIPYKDTGLMQMTNACKLMEYIACGVPIVVSDIGDYADFFPDNPECVCTPGDSASLAGAIEKQSQNKHIVDPGRVLSWSLLGGQLEQGLLHLLGELAPPP